MAVKTALGNFFEDFSVGQTLRDATPHSVCDGDRALYAPLTGSRFALNSSDEFARALSFNGLANALRVAAVNGGRHAAPSFAGDTVYAWSEVLEKLDLPGRQDLGALRLRTVATKDRPCADFPHRGEDGKSQPAVVFDLDYTVLMPRRT